MANRKYNYGRDPISIICQKLVVSHKDRIASIKLLEEEKKTLLSKIPGFNPTDMPKSFAQENDPEYKTYIRLEQIDLQIAEEQKRVEAVEAAIDHIGFYEKNPEIRQQIRKSILDNIRQGGYYMPYEYIDYPEKYGRWGFFQQRRAFLYEIAKNLYLNLKTR